jgi:hypothetical protein
LEIKYCLVMLRFFLHARGYSVVSEWHLICANAWKLQVVNAGFFAGALGGACIFNWLAEEFGA